MSTPASSPQQHRVPAPSPAGTTTRLEFTEEMRGYVGFGRTGFREGAVEGRQDGTRLSCHLTIDIDDLTAFTADPSHQAGLHGWVDCEALGGRRPIRHGTFNLFASAPQDGPGHQRMIYQMAITDCTDHPLTLRGHKQLRPGRAAGAGVWRETTTLYLHVLGSGTPPPGDAGAPAVPIVAAGILHLSMAGFLRQLTTVRVDAGSVAARLAGLGSFARLFLGDLWNLYRHRPGSVSSGRQKARRLRP
jgi:cholesterol oxidase